MKNRSQVVRAMDIMVSCINDEDIIEPWLMGGVADGDIKPDTTDEEIEGMGYCDDATFHSLLSLFLKLMYRARKDGLFADGIVSKTIHIEWK